MSRTMEEARREFTRTTGGLAKKPDYRWGGNCQLRDNEYVYHNGRLREPDPSQPEERDDDGNVTHAQGDRRRQTVLAQFINKRTLVINGAGFGRSGETEEQTRIRQEGERWALMKKGRTCLTVPFPAIESSGVNLDTLRPIDVQRDRWIDQFIQVDALPNILDDPEVRRHFKIQRAETSHLDAKTIKQLNDDNALPPAYLEPMEMPVAQPSLPAATDPTPITTGYNFPTVTTNTTNVATPKRKSMPRLRYEGRWGGHRWRVDIRQYTQYTNEQGKAGKIAQFFIHEWWVWATPEYAEADWTGVQVFGIVERDRRPDDDAARGGEDPTRFVTYRQLHFGMLNPNDNLAQQTKEFAANRAWHVREMVNQQGKLQEGARVAYGALTQTHRLGNAVFSAEDADGRRHRYVSGFDEQEPRPMYFFAQLPDKGACKRYEDAIHLLAPQIVHQALADGRHVVRQGDVFAIETNLTTEQVYERAVHRCRREVVIQDPTLAFQDADRRRRAYIEPDDGEVHVVDACPTCGHHGVRTGTGPRARNVLSIHGTGHTAHEVVVCKSGVTFGRGAMFHDPHIVPGDEDRAREHIDFALFRPEVLDKHNLVGHRLGSLRMATIRDNPQDFKWYLFVRNTVPRQKPARAATLNRRDRALTQDEAQRAASATGRHAIDRIREGVAA